MHAFLGLAFLAVASSLEYSEMTVNVSPGFGFESSGQVDFNALLVHTGSGSSPGMPQFSWNTVVESSYVSGMAKPNVDFRPVSNGVFTFETENVGQPSTPISVALVDDNVVEADETFAIEYAVGPGSNIDAITGINLGSGRAVGTIKDDEALTVLLVSADALEGQDAFFTFSVVLSHSVDTAFPVFLSPVSKNADWGVDFKSDDTTLTFAPGETEKHFQVEIINDDIQESIETFEVAVSYQPSSLDAIRSYEFSPSKTMTGTFLEEVEGVTVCIQDVTQAEGAFDTMDFDVVLSHKVNTEFKVMVKTVEGSSVGFAQTATNQLHYFSTQRTFTFSDKGSEKFSVTVDNDNVQSSHSTPTEDSDFGPLNFGVEYEIPPEVYVDSSGGAYNPWNVKACSGPERTGTSKGMIFDQEGVTISLSSTTLTLNESTTDFLFTVSLSHKVEGSPISGSSARGASFTFTDMNTGDADSYNANIEVNTPASGCATLSTLVVGAGPVDACWPSNIVPALVDGSTTPTVHVFNSIPGEQSAPQEFAFAQGPSEDIVEGTETFQIGIALEPLTAAGYGITLGTDSIEVTITETEEASFTMTTSPVDMSIAENEVAERMVITVEMDHKSSRDVTLSWDAESGSATKNQDFEILSNSNVLTWSAFSDAGAASAQSVVVNIKNDDMQEDAETFTVTFGDVTPAAMFPTYTFNTFEATITDDEGATISVNSMQVGQDESASSWDFTVQLSHEFQSEQTVYWSAQEDTITGFADRATIGQRFPVQGETIVFAAEEQESVIAVAVTDDNIQTGLPPTSLDDNAQSFWVTLDVTSAPLIDSSKSVLNGKVLVTDDETATVSIQDAFNQENALVADFTVVFSHLVTIPVVVNYATQQLTCDGCAEGGEDYVIQTDSSLTVPALSAEATLSVPLLDNKVQEGTETFAVHLYDVSLPSAVTKSAVHFAAVATITDTEFVTMSVSNAKGVEGDILEFKVEFTHQVSENVTITYTLLDVGAASFPDDFDNVDSSGSSDGQIIMEAYSQVAYIRVQAVDDVIAERAETFQVMLTGQTSGMSINSDGSAATGTIGSTSRFDEDVIVEVSAPSSPVTRSDIVTFEVTLSHVVAEAVSVSFQTVSGSALSSMDVAADVADYEYVSGTIVFPPMMDATVDGMPVTVGSLIPTCQGPQENQNFHIQLANPKFFTASPNLAALAELLPHDNTVMVTVSDGMSNEGEEMEFTVSLSSCLADDLKLAFSTQAGTATQYVNYNVPNVKLVNIPQGDTSGSFHISIVDDIIQSLQKTFGVTVVDATGVNANNYGLSFAAATGSSATGTIDDDEEATIMITQCVAQNPSDDSKFVFSVFLSHALDTTISFDYNTVEDTAKAGVDFIAESGSVFFGNRNIITKVITVDTIPRPDVVRAGDTTRFEVAMSAQDQTTLDLFKVHWSGNGLPKIVGGPATNSSGKGALLGLGDTVVHMRAQAATEGDRATFTATLTDEISTDVVIGFEAIPSTSGAVTNAADFALGSGQFTFKANKGTDQAVSFNILLEDDWLVEPTEIYDVVLTVISPAAYKNVIMFDGVEKGNQILDNDMATITVMDAVSLEPAPGVDTTDMIFSVVLSHFTYQDVSVSLNPESLCTRGHACVWGEDEIPTQMDSNADFWYPTSLVTEVTFSAGTGTVSKPDTVNSQVVAIKVLNDNVQEQAETFELTASVAASLVVDVDASDLTGTGTIDDIEGVTYIFSSTPVEEGDDITFDVSFTHDFSTDFVVEYATQDKSAFAGIDYVAQTDVFTISPSSPTGTFVVTTIDNDIQNPEDTAFDVVMLSTSPQMNIAPASAEGLIIDDYEGVKVRVTGQSVLEEDNAQLTFQMILSHKVEGGLTVGYSTTDIAGGAIAGLDYTTLTGEQVFFGGQLEQRFVRVSVNNDKLIETDEKVGLTSTIISPQSLLSKVEVLPATAEGVIIDNEDPTMWLRASKVVETEGSEMIFTVYLSHQVDESHDFTLQYDVQPMTQGGQVTTDSAWDSAKLIAIGVTAGQDFTSVVAATSPVLDFDRAYVPVPVIDDHIAESDERLSFSLSGLVESEVMLTSAHGQSVGVRLSGPVSVTGTIADNEKATISIENVDDWSETNSPVQLSVSMSHLSQPDVTVSYTTLDGFATSMVNADLDKNLDYISITDGLVVFPSVFSDSEDPRHQTIDIEIVDDRQQEEHFEDFCVQLRSIVSPSTIADIFPTKRDGFVGLVDDEEAATIYIETKAVSEGDILSFDVMMSHAVQAAPVTLEWAAAELDTLGGAGTPDVAATSVSDFVPAFGTITFPVSVSDDTQMSADKINIATVVDDLDEFPEYLAVNLFNLNGGDDVLQGNLGKISLGPKTISIAQNSGRGVINDSKGALDSDKLTISDGQASEDDKFIEFEVVFPRDTQTGDISFTFTTVTEIGDTAQPGRDYVPVTSKSATILAGQSFTTISVELAENSVVQDIHSFSVLISTPTFRIERSVAKGVITDNDKSEIFLVDATGAGEEDQSLVFGLTLSSKVDCDIGFKWYTRDGSAVTTGRFDNLDFQAVLESDKARETIPANSDSSSVTVTIMNDNVQEGDETFAIMADSLNMANPAITEVSWGRSTAEGTITDDEGVMVSVEDHSASESDQRVRFYVHLSHQIRIPNEVTFGLTSTTADSEDYSLFGSDSMDGIVDFSFCSDCLPGPTADIIFDITDDQVAEDDEHFLIQLTRSTTPISINEDKKEATFTIINDDFATIEITDATANENTGTMDFNVVLSHVVGYDVKVVVDTADGSAISGVRNSAGVVEDILTSNGVTQHDYVQLESYELLLEQGRTTLSVETLDDTEQECDETFSVRLALTPAQAGENFLSIDTSSAVGTLHNDNEGVVFKAKGINDGAQFKSEDQNMFLFQVELSHAVSEKFEVLHSLVATPESLTRLVDCSSGITAVGGSISACQSNTQGSFEVEPHLPGNIFFASQEIVRFRTDMYVPINDDIIAQPDGEFEIALDVSDFQCGRITVVNPKGTILDNEQATIQMEDVSMRESGDHNMPVVLSHGIEFPIVTTWNVMNAAGDLTSTTGTVTFSPDQSRNLVAFIDVLDDQVREDDEVYTVELTSDASYVRTSGGSLVIVNDDTSGSSFAASADDATTDEGQPLVFTVTPEGEFATEQQVEWTASGSSNIADRESGVLTWAPNDMTFQVISLETFNLGGCSLDSSVNLVLKDSFTGTSTFATGTIKATGGPEITLLVADAVTSGSDTVIVASMSSVCPFAVTVPFSIGVTAVAGVTVEDECVITAGTTSCSVVLSATDNATPGDQVPVSIGDWASANPSFGSGSWTVDTQDVVILAKPALSFGQSAYSVGEGESVEITASLTAAQTTDTVFLVLPGGIQYTIPASSTSTSWYYDAESTANWNPTYTVDLSIFFDGATVDSTVVTIEDSMALAIAIASSSTTVTAGDSLIGAVSLNTPSSVITSYFVRTTGLTATDGVNYESIDLIGSIDAGETTATFDINTFSGAGTFSVSAGFQGGSEQDDTQIVITIDAAITIVDPVDPVDPVVVQHAPVVTVFNCNGDVSSEGVINIASGADFVSKISLAGCFIDLDGDAISYSLVSGAGSITGDVLTLSSNSPTTASVTVRATAGGESVEHSFTVIADLEESVTRKNLVANGLRFPQYGSVQRLVTTVYSDVTVSENINQCVQDRQNQDQMTDCCVLPMAGLVSDVCERVFSLTRASQESIKLGLRSDVAGINRVCLGAFVDETVREDRYCFSVEVTAPMTLLGPTSVVGVAGQPMTVITKALGVEGNDLAFNSAGHITDFSASYDPDTGDVHFTFTPTESTSKVALYATDSESTGHVILDVHVAGQC